MLAYLAGGEKATDLAVQLFDAFVATGRNTAAISAITVAEILVRPFRRGPAAVATAEGFLRHFGDLRLIDVTYDIAREGARIRAETDLPMPDALSSRARPWRRSRFWSPTTSTGEADSPKPCQASTSSCSTPSPR